MYIIQYFVYSERRCLATQPCKEDAFQAVWDATIGKRGMYVKGLTGENKAALPDYAKDAAGLYIRLKEFQVDSDDLTQLPEAGVNPYAYLKIVEAPICLGVVA